MFTEFKPNGTENAEKVADMFAMNAHVFRDMIAGALVGAGKDKFVPVLTVVHVEFNTDTVRTVSTDRYRLVIGETLSTDGVIVSGSGAFNMPNDFAKDLVKSLPKSAPKIGEATVSVKVENDVITVDYADINGTWVKTARTELGEFPRYRSLVPDWDSMDNPSEITQVSYNPQFLADIAKLPVHGKGKPVRLRFTTQDKPVMARFVRDYDDAIEWTYLLMPVRIPS